MDSKIASSAHGQAFWVRYFSVLSTFRIPEKTHPWYQKHVEQFIAFLPDTQLQNRSAEDTQKWLETLSRQQQIADWQFRQKVNALRLLYGQLFHSDWARHFDWDFWSLGVRRLEADHSSITRTYEMIDEKVSEKKNYLAKEFPELYRRFLAVIRIPDYSINTEKSYLGWINRFLAFHSPFSQNPCPKQISLPF